MKNIKISNYTVTELSSQELNSVAGGSLLGDLFRGFANALRDAFNGIFGESADMIDNVADAVD